jgi:hypothetical protein
MNPIFTYKNPQSLPGYRYDEFVQHFDSICKEHLVNDRAKKFAFIVYNFHSPTHEVLQNQGVFIELDRLSGKDITVFYLDGQTNQNRNSQSFLFANLNNILLELTGDEIRSLPFVVFFDFKNNDVSNLKCYPIRDDKKFIVNDLSNAIRIESNSLPKTTIKKRTSVLNSLIRDTPKIIYTEFIKLIFKDIVDLSKR